MTLVRPRQDNGATRHEEVKARLLSYNNAPVWQIGGEIVTGLHADHIRFPELPGNLYSRPTFIWSLDKAAPPAPRRGLVPGDEARMERRLRADRRARRQGRRRRWLGDADQRQRHIVPECKAAARRRRAESGAPGISPPGSRQATGKSCGGGRRADDPGSLLRLPPVHARPEDDVNNNETKQVSMLGATGFPVRKRYVVDGQSYYYRNAQNPGAPIKDVVKVSYQFKNEQSAGLGMPMPAGVVRVYQADSKGGLQFVGEDRIDHTPKDETLNLKIGHAFDVVAERKQIDFEKIASNVYEMEYEVVLRNHKTTPVTVEVNEPIGGTWRMHPVVARRDEDRCLGRAVQRAGGRGRRLDAALPDPGDLLATRAQQAARERTIDRRFSAAPNHERDGQREGEQGIFVPFALLRPAPVHEEPDG